MDFLDPAKKRAHTIRLFIGYGLMAILIGMAAVILLYRTYGYDFDRSTGTVIQKGLLFLSAGPESADIYINGEKHRSRTDLRTELPSGDYTVELRRDGYRSWKRSFNLQGGNILRLVYPRLFPEQLVTRDEFLYADEPALSMQSPDRRWLMIQNPDKINEFTIYDLNNPADAPVQAVFPTALFSSADGGSPRLTLAEWSTDNRHVLVRHDYGDGHEFIMLDREEPAESYNVNRTFKINPTNVVLRDKSYDRLYLYEADGGVLQTAELRDTRVRPLLTKVLAFKPHGDDVLVYALDGGSKSKTTALMIREGDNSYQLTSVPRHSSYLLDVARYNDSWYYAVGSAPDKRVRVYKNPVEFLRRDTQQVPVPVAVLRVDAPQYLGFSQNARMIGLQGRQNFAVYDAETERQYAYKLPNPLAKGVRAEWMDGHRYAVVSEGKTLVFDYDGINIQALTNVSPRHRPYFDRDYEALYTIGPSPMVEGRTALIRTELVVEDQ